MKAIIFGISGKVLTHDEAALMQSAKPHGIILFSRNCESKSQITLLTSSIKSISPATKIFIDQEGGRVARVKPPIEGARVYPNMEYFGNIYDKDRAKAIKAVEENFYQLMSELKELGIDVTCAPVCDLQFKDAHIVIGDRSFGGEVDKVVALSKAALDGVHRAGGEGVLKHIPGHGRALSDSHKELPRVTAPLAELEETDFAVFKALAGSCAYAMTAHVVYDAIDPILPATTSSKVIEYIRSSIGFSGFIMTDALEMKALSGTILDRATASWDAGCDIALHCTGKIEDIIPVLNVTQKTR